MALKNTKSFECITTAELTEFNFKWTINNVSFCLFTHPQSNLYKTGENVCWFLNISNVLNLLQFQLNLYTKDEHKERMWVKYEFFLIKFNNLVRLTKPVHALFYKNPPRSQTTDSAFSLLKPEEILQHKTGPEDSLTFVCRMVVQNKRQTTKVVPVPKTDFNTITIPQSQMGQDFEVILESQLLADVTLIVEGKHLKAHKAILAARSPVFAAMFNADMVENRRDQVTITDMTYEVAQQMLRFIYTDKAVEIETKMAACLLAAADKYALIKLKAECERTICDNLTASTAIETLNLADRHSASQLKSHTIQFIRANWDKVLEGGDLKSMVGDLYQALDMK